MTGQQRDPATQLFALIDAMDVSAFGEHLDDHAQMVFGNSDPVIGRDNVVKAVTEFFETIRGLRHELLRTWHVAGDTIVRALVTYQRKDGEQVTVPAATIYHTNTAGMIDEYRIFVDLTPVYA